MKRDYFQAHFASVRFLRINFYIQVNASENGNINTDGNNNSRNSFFDFYDSDVVGAYTDVLLNENLETTSQADMEKANKIENDVVSYLFKSFLRNDTRGSLKNMTEKKMTRKLSLRKDS